MNKWSLLLFSVLGLLLSTTSELNFVDGRYGWCDRLSRSLLSDTRLSIYEPHCAYNTFSEITQPTLPQRDIRVRYTSKNVELKRSSRSKRRQRQFEVRRISSDERSRVLNNDVSDFEDSTLSYTRDRKALRDVYVIELRRNVNSFSRDNFRENHVERSRSLNNADLWNRMERNSRERRINIEVESIIPDNRFRRNDRVENFNLKERNQERFTRRTIGIRTNNITPNLRKSIDEMKPHFKTQPSLIQKQAGKIEMERSNLDMNTRRKLFRDARLTSNIWDYRRLSVWDISVAKMYESESRTDVRRNSGMERNINFYRRNNDEDKQVLTRNINKNVVIRVQNERLDKGSPRSKIIQKEGEGTENRRLEKKLFEERYSTRRVSRQNSYINRVQEIRQARICNDRHIGDGEDNSNVFTKITERTSDLSRNRNIRDNNREIRLSEEYKPERITPLNKNSLEEKRAISPNLNNRRNEATRDDVLERREREDSRFRLDYENENIFVQRRIRQIRNSQDGHMLREARNTQRRFIQNNAMGQEINNNRQINVNEDTISERLNRNDDDRKLDRRLEREGLSRTGIRASPIRSIQRENQYKMHNDNDRVLNIQENRLQEDSNYNRRFLPIVSNTNRNVEKQRSRTYDDKLGREEFRHPMLRGTERSFDDIRIRQIRDNHEVRREYRLNEERTIERVLTRIDRNRNNVVEKSFVSFMSRLGDNRYYGSIKDTVTVLQRPENNEFKYRSVPENERNFDQSRIRYVRERRDVDLSVERLAQRNLARINSMKEAILSNNRRIYNDENNADVIFVGKNNKEMANRSERDGISSNNKRSFYLRMIQRQHEIRMHNNYRQLINRHLQRQDSNIYRIVENRRSGSPTERHDYKNILTSETKRSKKLIERQERILRTEVDVDQQNQITRLTFILLQRREKEQSSLMRQNEQEIEDGRNGIIGNRREYLRIEDHSRNNGIAKIRRMRNINERLNTRNAGNIIIRNVGSEIKLHNSDETRHERRNERVIRYIARNEMDRTTHRMRVSLRKSINSRVLLEDRSVKQEDVNRELEYMRSHHGLRNIVKINVRSERDNNRGRDPQHITRDIRASNGLEISKNSRLTTRRTNEEKRVRYLATEDKAQSNNQLFEMKLQYVFYLLQGLYILGLYTKSTKEADGIQKRTRFNKLFPLFSTLKMH